MGGNELPPIRPLTKKHYWSITIKHHCLKKRVKLFRIQKICLSLFKQIQGYEEDLEREMTPGRNYRRKKNKTNLTKKNIIFVSLVAYRKHETFVEFILFQSP